MTASHSPLPPLETAIEVLWQHCSGTTPELPERRHLARALVIALEAGRHLPRLNDKTQGPLFTLDAFIELSANSLHLQPSAPSLP